MTLPTIIILMIIATVINTGCIIALAYAVIQLAKATKLNAETMTKPMRNRRTT